MKKIHKLILVIVVIGITFGIIFFSTKQSRKKSNREIQQTKLIEEKELPENMKYKMKAVIVKVYDNNLMIMQEDDQSLLSVGFTDEGNIGYKKGQEILIYYNGMIAASYPGQMSKPGKIEILKEESNIEIPEDNLRYCYSSRKNVDIEIEELNNTEISLVITDKNELQYKYSNSYIIYKEVKNEKYPETPRKIGEDTEHSISGYTRNRTRICMERS